MVSELTYRRMLAELYWEDSGLSIWHDDRFTEATQQAIDDADPDNPNNLIHQEAK